MNGNEFLFLELKVTQIHSSFSLLTRFFHKSLVYHIFSTHFEYSLMQCRQANERASERIFANQKHTCEPFEFHLILFVIKHIENHHKMFDKCKSSFIIEELSKEKILNLNTFKWWMAINSISYPIVVGFKWISVWRTTFFGSLPISNNIIQLENVAHPGATRFVNGTIQWTLNGKDSKKRPLIFINVLKPSSSLPTHTLSCFHHHRHHHPLNI